MLPEPYNSIWTLPADDHGWFRNGFYLEKCIEERQVRIAVELGSWLGQSTIFIAQRLPENGLLYAVDTWLGSEDQIGLKDCEVRFPLLYQQFISNIKHAGLCDRVIPCRMTTLEGARCLMVSPELVYVDAAHDADSVYHDIMAWYPKLAPGGVMCGDDWDWSTVREGVHRAAQELGQKVWSDQAFWRLV